MSPRPPFPPFTEETARQKVPIDEGERRIFAPAPKPSAASPSLSDGAAR